MADYIIDLGAYESTFGKAGEDKFESKERMIMVDSDDPLIQSPVLNSLSTMAKERIFGNEALKFKNVLNVRNILKDQNYDAFASLIQEIFESHYLDPRDFGLILIVPQNFPNIYKEKIQDILFSRLHFPKITYLTHGMCALTALGKDTGAVVDIGHYSTRVEGFFKGFPNEECHKELPVGGYHITDRLVELISPKLNYDVSVPLKWLAEEIKQNHVKCELNPGEIIQQIQKGSIDYGQKFEMPDGKILKLGRELFECTEIFFNPSLIHVHSKNIVDLLEESIRSWDRSNVPQLAKNILVCGNGGSIEGLTNKISLMLQERFPKSIEVEFLDLKDRKGIFWIGASVLYMKRKGKMEWIPNPNQNISQKKDNNTQEGNNQ